MIEDETPEASVARTELAKSRQRQRLHFERTPLAVIEWDLDFCVVEWNPAAERIFGYSKREALGRHAAGLIVPEVAREHVDRIWTELLRKSGGLRSTNENNHRDGHTILCEWYNTPLVDEDGGVLGVASLVQDVTDAQRAERALRASEENLRITLDSIGDAVIATDATGEVRRMNPVAETLTGWSFAEAAGRPLADVFRLYDPQSLEPTASPIDEILAGHAVAGPAALSVLYARDGRKYLISDSGAPIRDREGRVVGMVLVFRDETAKHSLAEQARRVQRLDAIGMLAGGIAHDFNNMLVGILGYAELLAEQLEDQDKPRSYAEGIMRAARNAAGLTGQLLAFSRKGTTGGGSTDVHDAIRDAVGLLERSIDRRIRLETALGAERSLVEGDAVQLQSALLNLGINARDAMPAGGTLELSTFNHHLTEAHCAASPFELSAGEYLRIRVRDDGEGIPRDVLDRIFDPFFSTKDVGKGTGLGLAAVYGTIISHHGSISVESEPGGGTEFLVDLPLCDAEDSQARASTPGCIEGSGRILIVDDEPVVRETIQSLVEDLGYSTLLAVDGVDGLRVFRENASQIDAVVLDVVMPNMNGRDCLDELRRLHPELKVVLCSGYPSAAGVEELLRRGDTGYVKKPFSRREIGLALRAVLEARG